jgi:hypothetical protein
LSSYPCTYRERLADLRFVPVLNSLEHSFGVRAPVRLVGLVVTLENDGIDAPCRPVTGLSRPPIRHENTCGDSEEQKG